MTNPIGGTMQVVQLADIPYGGASVTGTSGTVANGSAVATLAGVSGKTTYITGFSVTGLGATAALNVVVTVANTITGNLTYQYQFVVGATAINVPLHVNFSKPIPANAANTAITVTCPASGAGGTSNIVNAYGYQL